MDSENQVVLSSGSSTAGAIRKLILNIMAARESLVECGYKRIVIDVVNPTVTVETIDGKEEIIPITSRNDEKGRFNFIFKIS
jgi:hypothetical protein